MHRSGTSAVARCLAAAGVFMGEEADLLPPSETNQSGYWELSDVVDANESVLERCGVTWSSVVTQPVALDQDPVIQRNRRDLLETIRRHFGPRAVWGWKDPRTSILLPFWKETLKQAGVSAHYIVCVRAPAEVAASLHRRNGMAADHSHRLWCLYTLLSLVDTEDQRRCVIDYEDLLENPAGVIGSSLCRLGLAGFEPNSETARAVEQAVDPGLRHSRSNISARIGAAEVLVSEVYGLAFAASKDRQLLEDSAFKSRCRDLLGDYLGMAHFVRSGDSTGHLQLYSGAGGSFHPDSSSSVDLDAVDGFQTVDIEVKASAEGLYRIDPTDFPSVVDFASIELARIGADGSRSIVHRWDSVRDSQAFELIRDAVWSTDSRDRLICIGVDPGLIVRTEPIALEANEKLSFRLALRCVPCPSEPFEALAKLEEQAPARVKETLWRLVHGDQPMPRSGAQRVFQVLRRAFAR